MSKHDQTILEIERALLATLMLRPGDCHRVEIAPEHFLSEQHADILATIHTLTGDSKPTDPLSVSDYLEQQGRRPLGALAVSISSEALTTAVPEAFAHRVLTAWRQRKAREIGMSLVESTSEKAVDQAISALMNLHAIEQNHEWDAKQATRQAWQEIVEIHETGGKLPGVTTGLTDVDDKLGGLHKGDLIVVGARAAMGKTALLLGMARSAAMAGDPVGIISGEQPVNQVSLRMLAAAAKVDARKFRTANFQEEDWPRIVNSVAANSELPMWFLDRSAPTAAEVVRVARRWKHKHGIRALYVDYLQRIVGEGERKYEQVGMVAKTLKNLARDLEIPVIVLAQVSRDVEKSATKPRAPRMGDLSDSSEIEKEADQILMIYREGYYDANASQSEARVIVEKNRHGPTGYVDVAWNGAFMVFGDLANGYDDSFGSVA
jgi:replicative DNA helicase